jgi:hypothetical protein
MSNLTKAAEKRFRRISQRPETPSWWNMAQVVIGVLFFFYLGYSLLNPATAPTPLASQDAAEVTDTAPGSPTTLPGTAAPGNDTPSTTVVEQGPVPEFTGAAAAPVAVAFADGGTTSVPTGLLDLARRAAAANQGADRTGIPVLADSTWATPATPWPDAVGGDALLVSLDDRSATFRVLVTRSSTPAAAGAWTSVKLVASDGSWVFAPGAV